MSDYDTDILVWSKHQAALLRRRATGELLNKADLDWSNIAEEIETLDRSDRRELRTRVATILVHLIKLEVSPATDPRAGWRVTVLEQRISLRDVLRDSPSLTRTVAAIVADEIEAAREIAVVSLAGEEARVDPATLIFTVDQVLGPWLPERCRGLQQMQWTRRGAHLLLQTQAYALDGTLRPLFERWYLGLPNDSPPSSLSQRRREHQTFHHRPQRVLDRTGNPVKLTIMDQQTLLLS